MLGESLTLTRSALAGSLSPGTPPLDSTAELSGPFSLLYCVELYVLMRDIQTMTASGANLLDRLQLLHLKLQAAPEAFPRCYLDPLADLQFEGSRWQ